MIVWVLETGEYSSRFILGVFDNLNLAKEIVDSRYQCKYLAYKSERKYYSHKHGWYSSGMGLSNDCHGGVDITPYELNTLP